MAQTNPLQAQPLLAELTVPSSFGRFLTQQGEIYNRFHSFNELSENGSKVSSVFLTPKAGYIVALRHSEEICDYVAEISEKIGLKFRGTQYQPESVHTTLLGMIGEPLEQFKPRADVIDNLYHKAIDICCHIKQPLGIAYSGFGANRDTVILEGFPISDQLVRVAFSLEASVKPFIPELRPLSMAHITVFRFGEEKHGAEILELCETLGSLKPPPISTPLAIDIGYFTASQENFEMHRMCSITL